MRRSLALLVIIGALVGGADVPARAEAQECVGLGTAAPYDVFTRGNYTVANTQIQGRVAAGGDVSVASYGIGTLLSPDPARADLIAGGSLTASNAQAANGSVTFATTLSGTISTPHGTLTRAPAPFSFDEAFSNLALLSAQLAELPPNGTISGPTYGALQLTGGDAARNVFSITAAQLQSAQQIQIRVPFGSTTIVNVSGATYSTATLPTTSISFWNGSSYVQLGETAPSPQLEALRRALLWNFPLATRVQIGPNLAWQGSLLAPGPALAFQGSTQLVGQIIAASLAGDGTDISRSFEGCLPPAPTHNLSLVALCRDPVTNRTSLRLRNTGTDAVAVTWGDADSAQTGAFRAGAGDDRFFSVADGEQPHRITVVAAGESVSAATSSTPCGGTVLISKVTSGSGTPPPGPWRIEIDGSSGFSGEAELLAGQSQSFAVPGTYQDGSAPIGGVVGGYTYTVSEPDPLGAVATVSHLPVTITDGQSEAVVVGNAYSADGGGAQPGEEGGGEDLIPELPEPGEPVVTPPQPEVLPGAPGPLPGPNLHASHSAAAGADLAVSETISPTRTTVGGVVTASVTVRNQGNQPAPGVVVRELPQRDPANPSRVVQIVSVDSGMFRCTRTRPVQCELGTLAAGEQVTIRGRGRLLVSGLLKSVVLATTTAPETNTTNNFGTAAVLSQAAIQPLYVSVRVPSPLSAGEPTHYRVSVAAGRSGVSAVRLCQSPSPGLLVDSAPGTLRDGGKLCIDIDRLRPHQSRGFTVNAVAVAAFAGHTVVLPASADSPGRSAPVRGGAATRILAAALHGLG